MVAKGFGSKDTDKVGKEKTDSAFPKAGAMTPYTGKIGGKGNATSSGSASKGSPAYAKFKRGGGVKRGR